jgi:peroxiredoxin
MSPTGTPSLLNQPAVDFRLADLGGQTHTLSDYRGRWLLLDFHRHLG